MNPRICSWCKRTVEEGDPRLPVSHTCCNACAVGLHAEIDLLERSQKKVAVENIIDDLLAKHSVTGKY